MLNFSVGPCLLDGVLLKEVDRILRPKGYFVYSAPPAYRSDKNFPQEWKLILNFTSSMCWELVAHEVQTAIWQKTADRFCQLKYAQNGAPLCHNEDDPDKSWNKPMQDCIYLVQESEDEKRLLPWPARLWAPPQRLEGNSTTHCSTQLLATSVA